jgi:hypothetical protein
MSSNLRAPLLGLGLALVTGCAPTVSANGSRYLEPLPADSSAPARRWQQYCVRIYSGASTGATYLEASNDYLAKAGEAGWELVAKDGTDYCFKREVVAAAPAPSAPAPAAPVAPAVPADGAN